MSKIYCCEYGNKQIDCKRVFQEENAAEANRFAQRRAGGMSTEMNVKVIRDGQKIYQLVCFSKGDAGYINISCNKILQLKKGDKVAESISQNLPEEAVNFLNQLTGVDFNIKNDSENTSSDSNEKQEAFLRRMFTI